MKKKIVALLLALVLLLTYSPIQTFADPEDELISGIDWSWDMVANSASNLDIGGSAAATSAISLTFSDCMSVVSGVSSVLGLVNGSVNFLKLIGVIEDPTATALANIQDMLNDMNAKMDAMDEKLDNITTKMTEIKASIDFNARASKASDMRKAWNDFEKNYMEQKLDKYMARFKTLSITAMRNWFLNNDSNPRKGDEIDNSIIVIKYVYNESKKEYVQSFINDNEIPASCESNEKYVVIPEDCIPQKPVFNVNTYRNDLKKAISDSIEYELAKGNDSIFETLNYSMPTEKEDINALAADAVNALCYRVSSVAVRDEEYFVSDAVYDFNAYCKNLLSDSDGVDAKFKSFYLTHAFEFEISNSVKEFADQMIFKTGVYALFLSNIMGMTNMVEDNDKKTVMKNFADTTKALSNAKDNCLTGNSRYCYITNTELDYCTVTYQNNVMAKVEIDGLYRNYKDMWIDPIKYTVDRGLTDYKGFIGEENMLVLAYTLRASGVSEPYHGYFYEHLAIWGDTPDYGLIVTGAGRESNLDKNSGVKMKVNYVCGDYLENNDSVYLNKLPEDMSSKNIQVCRKYTAPTFNMNTGAIENETLLHAAAGYGDTDWMWFEDEVYLLGGPYNSKGCVNNLSNDGKYYRTFTLNLQNNYNTLVTNTVNSESLTSGSGYSPLASYAEFLNEPVSREKGRSSKSGSGSEQLASFGGLNEANPDTGAYVDFEE